MWKMSYASKKLMLQKLNKYFLITLVSVPWTNDKTTVVNDKCPCAPCRRHGTSNSAYIIQQMHRWLTRTGRYLEGWDKGSFISSAPHRMVCAIFRCVYSMLENNSTIYMSVLFVLLVQQELIQITLFVWVNIMNMFIQSCFHGPLTTISNKETFLRDFLVILKRTLQKITKKCFLGTTWTVMLAACSNLLPHTGVLSVAEESDLFSTIGHNSALGNNEIIAFYREKKHTIHTNVVFYYNHIQNLVFRENRKYMFVGMFLAWDTL